MTIEVLEERVGSSPFASNAKASSSVFMVTQPKHTVTKSPSTLAMQEKKPFYGLVPYKPAPTKLRKQQNLEPDQERGNSENREIPEQNNHEDSKDEINTTADLHIHMITTPQHKRLHSAMEVSFSSSETPASASTSSSSSKPADRIRCTLSLRGTKVPNDTRLWKNMFFFPITRLYVFDALFTEIANEVAPIFLRRYRDEHTNFKITDDTREAQQHRHEAAGAITCILFETLALDNRLENNEAGQQLGRRINEPAVALYLIRLAQATAAAQVLRHWPPTRAHTVAVRLFDTVLGNAVATWCLFCIGRLSFSRTMDLRCLVPAAVTEGSILALLAAQDGTVPIDDTVLREYYYCYPIIPTYLLDTEGPQLIYNKTNNYPWPRNPIQDYDMYKRTRTTGEITPNIGIHLPMANDKPAGPSLIDVTRLNSRGLLPKNYGPSEVFNRVVFDLSFAEDLKHAPGESDTLLYCSTTFHASKPPGAECIHMPAIRDPDHPREWAADEAYAYQWSVSTIPQTFACSCVHCQSDIVPVMFEKGAAPALPTPYKPSEEKEPKDTEEQQDKMEEVAKTGEQRDADTIANQKAAPKPIPPRRTAALWVCGRHPELGELSQRRCPYCRFDPPIRQPADIPLAFVREPVVVVDTMSGHLKQDKTTGYFKCTRHVEMVDIVEPSCPSCVAGKPASL